MKVNIPYTATHICPLYSTTRSGGHLHLCCIVYKNVNGEWFKYRTDSDNEYPEWVLVNVPDFEKLIKVNEM